jgi:hypothetical protein
MRSIKLGLALVAALAFSVAMTASASAASFLASGKEALLTAKVAKQVFKTREGTVECSEAKIVKGESTAGETTSQEAEIEYKKCLAFGAIPTELKNALYNFLASGSTHIKNTIKIVSSGCTVVVGPQSVSSVGYKTVGNNIELIPKVTGIAYKGENGCPQVGTFADGEYTGNSEVMTASGKLSFMP